MNQAMRSVHADGCRGWMIRWYPRALIAMLLLAVTGLVQATTRAEAEAAIAAAEATIATAEAAGLQDLINDAALKRAKSLLGQRGYTLATGLADGVREPLEQALAEARAAAEGGETSEADAAALKDALAEVRQETLERLQGIEQQFGTIEPRLGGTDEQLKLLEEAIDENRQALDDLEQRVTAGLAGIDPLRVRVDGLAEGLKRADEQLKQHEVRLEDNGLKLFETLMGIDNSGEALAALSERLDALVRGRLAPRQGGTEANTDVTLNAAAGAQDDSGLLLALVLGLAFPVGVLLYLGLGPGADARLDTVDFGLVPWLAGGVGYVLIGFGLMFGPSWLGLIGMPVEVLPDLLQVGNDQVLSEPLRQLSMQLPLAGAASLLFCSAVAGRLSPGACLLAALIMGAFLYPLVGHWTLIAWGAGDAVDRPIGWLAVAGLSDAGDAIGLAALAGVGSLALAWGLGRVAGRTASLGAGTNLGADGGSALIAVGTLILWAAWLVSVVATGAVSGTVPWLALASAAAAAGAAAAVVLVGLLRFDERSWEQRLPGGLLAGVLAASAAYALAGLVPMLLLGLVTGAIYALSISAVRRRFGPAADLALVFAVGGISGALAPGLLGPEGLLAAGVVSGLMTQALGLTAVLVLAIGAGMLIALALRALPGRWVIAE